MNSYLTRVVSADFAREIAETFGTRVLLIAVGLVSSVITARVLGPEGRGLCAVAAAVGAIGVQLGHLGLHASNTYYVARDRSLLSALVGNALLIAFGFGAIGGAALGTVFTLRPSLAPVHGPLLLLALIWIPFGLAYWFLQNLLLGVAEVRAYNTIELGSKVLSLALIVLAVLVGLSQPVPVFAAGLFALVFAVVWSLRRLWVGLNQAPWPSAGLFSTTIRYGIKSYAGHLFAFLVLRVDLVLVQYILGPEQTGYYSVATNMGDMLYLFPVVVGMLLFPRLSAVEDTAEKWAATKRVAAVIAVLMVVTCGVTAYVAAPAVAVLFGPAFAPAAPALLFLLPGLACLGVSSVLSSYIASIDIPLSLVVMYFIVFVLNFVLNLIFLPRFGIVAASVNSSITYALAHLYLWRLVRGRLHPDVVNNGLASQGATCVN